MAGDLPVVERLVVVGDQEAFAEAGTPAGVPEPTGRVLHVYGDRVRVETPSLFDVTDPAEAAGGPEAAVSDDVLAGLSETERLGVLGTQLRRSADYADAKAQRPRQGDPWDMEYSCTDQTP